MACGVVSRQAKAYGLDKNKNVLEDVSDNFSGAGTHVKITRIAQGLHVIQHKHEYAHLSVLLTGRVIVKCDIDSWVMDATDSPKSIVIAAGRYHSVTALTDAIWLCVHKDPETEPVLQNEVA